MSAGKLAIWTVYDHPADYPDCYVAREWAIDRGTHRATGNVVTSNSLDAIRTMMLKSGLTCLGREATDDPKIVESWV